MEMLSRVYLLRGNAVMKLAVKHLLEGNAASKLLLLSMYLLRRNIVHVVKLIVPSIYVLREML